MMPPFAFLVALWAGSAYAPGALDRQLAARESGAAALPLEHAREEARRLQLVLHDRRATVAAVYEPATGKEPARLLLYAPHYLRGVELRPVLDLQVDLAEGLFHALLASRLERELALPQGELAAKLRRRAEATMVDVPARHRLQAYLDAQASFGAHVLAVANELDRSEARRRAAGASLCPLLGRPLPLLRLWERMLAGNEPYPGAYVDHGPHGEERVRWSRSTLGRDDKRLLVERVLRAPWTGAVAHDLEPGYCRRR
jgi:hypothetical protein